MNDSEARLYTPATDSTPTAADREFLWHVHEYINEYVRFGDAKAGFAGAVASGLLAGLYSSTVRTEVLHLPFYVWSCATWLGVLASAFLALSVLLALWIVRPRLGSTQPKGFIFWGSIAAYSDVSSLKESFRSQSTQTLDEHLLHHIFDLSTKVCVPKYRYISLCILALGIGGVLAAGSLVLQGTGPELPAMSSQSVGKTIPANADPSGSVETKAMSKP